MDLVKLIADKVQEIETSGKMNEIIEKNVISCIEDIVRDSFKWNGEAKKAIESALEGKLGVNMEEVKIPQYNKVVASIVTDQLNNTSISHLKDSVVQAVNNITETLDKKEWKLSEIIAKYIENLDTSYDGEMEDQYGELTLIVKNDGEFCHVDFDKESDLRSYECKNKLFFYKGKLSGVELDEKPFSPHLIAPMNTFERFMFKLYCNNVIVEIDENKCQTEYYREDCN